MLESSDDDLPPLPPPMPTLEEPKKVLSQSGAKKVHFACMHSVCHYTVLHVFSSTGIVEVFDSMPAYSTTSSGLKRQVAAILKTSEKSLI